MDVSADCERCGTSLSYGEVFRHSIALDVAAGRFESKRILGDTLSPRKPRKFCTDCRTHEHRFAPRGTELSRPRRIVPLAAAFAGIMVAGLLAALHRR
jgi:hypothetical protein